MGFQDRTEGQVKKHSGAICLIKRRGERESEARKIKKMTERRREREKRT